LNVERVYLHQLAVTKSMVRTAVKVVLFDAAVLVVLLMVLNDLSLRSSYARSRMPSTSYLPFLRVLSTVRTCRLPCVSMTLSSPSTLDWVQVLVVLLLVWNLAFILNRRASRRNEGAA
jgi:hypothetical protein